MKRITIYENLAMTAENLPQPGVEHHTAGCECGSCAVLPSTDTAGASQFSDNENNGFGWALYQFACACSFMN